METTKKLFYLLLLNAFSLSIVFGQSYKLSVSQEEYNSLENPTILTDQGYRLDTAFHLSLPFEFDILDQKSNSIWITSKGNIAFGQSYDSLSHIGINAFRIELQSDFINPATSPILYEISGDEGERIVKIEWESAYFRALEGFFDFINMQVWLYEKDQSVELRYGESSLELITTRYQDEDSLGHFGGIVGIAFNTDTSYIGTNLTGDSTLPIITNTIINNPNTIPAFRLGFPKDSTVFKLTKISTFNKNTSQNNLFSAVYFGNSKQIKISSKKLLKSAKYHLVSPSGHLIRHNELTSISQKIDVSALTSGIYILSINDGNNSIQSWKFSIIN